MIWARIQGNPRQGTVADMLGRLGCKGLSSLTFIGHPCCLYVIVAALSLSAGLLYQQQ